MKKAKKRLLTAPVLTLAAVILVVASVFTTMAYLTGSAAVSNTFTVGNVMIAMYESKVNDNGEALPDSADIHGSRKDSDGNNYHLLPGATYDKDPTIYIDKGSDTSYLFVKIRNNISPIEKGNFVHKDQTQPVSDPDAPTIKEQMTAYGWMFFTSTATGDVYVYAGKLDNSKLEAGEQAAIVAKTAAVTKVGSKESEQAFNVFDTFTIDEHADVSIYGGAKVTLTAFAIQTAGFEDDTTSTAVQKAWAAIVETYPYEDGAAVSEP